jgi:hypothetical protein
MANPECPYCGDPVEPAHVKTFVEREGGIECYHEACEGRRRADLLDAEREADKARIADLEGVLRDCMEIAGSDCEHELCKAIIERASPLVRED